MKFNTTLKRWIAGTIVLCHAGVLAVPAMAAVEQEAFGRAKPGTEGSVSQSDLERLQELVKHMQMRLKDFTPQAKASTAKIKELNQQKQALQTKTAQQILELRSNIASETAKAVADLRTEAKLFKDKTIAQRQEQTAKLIEQRQAIMEGLFNQLAEAKDDTSRNASLTKITQQMAQWEPKKLQRDFKELPWGRPDSKVPAPVTAQDFKKLGPALEFYQVKASEKLIINPLYKAQKDISVLSPDEIWKQATPTVLTTSSVGQWQKIAFNGMMLSNQDKWPVLASLPVATLAEDLKANEDVQITQEIKDLAKQLDHNPAKIYKWVYDNIEFVPTYGSIQGSAYTLETKRGNATDTSSLLIALLRASGIPARYVSGTIDVPAEVAKDWVGGVNNLSAAGNLIGQGGVPSVIIMNGGKESHLRMEHMWVEAKMDFIPSKGAVQTSGQNNPNIEDSWVPLDASYKSYERTKGIDLAKAVPFDTGDFINKAQQGATIEINEQNSSFKNINTKNTDKEIELYNEKVISFLGERYSGSTIAEIFGSNKIISFKSKMLSPVLPYKVVAVVRDYHTLPNTMRHYFNLNIYNPNDPYAAAMGSYAVQFKIPSTQLKGKPLALSFRPSSKSDVDAILNVFPKLDSTGDVDLTKLPRSLSTSINMTGEITLDGEILTTLPSYAFGSEIQANIGFTSPNSNWSLPNKELTVGAYHAIGYNLQGISKNQLTKINEKMMNAKSKLESKDEQKVKTISIHDMTGSLLQAVVQTYFGLNDTQGKILARQHNIVENSYMSFGTFSTSVQGVYTWGILRSARLGGMIMDIDRISAISVEKNNNNLNLQKFRQQQGIRQSAYENLVPERFFNDPNSLKKNVDGISAIKALHLANTLGQEIYVINSQNINSILPKLQHDSGTISDVRNAIASGKTVTISQSEISVNNWKGSGYIILDENTGSGAYMISGGLNGGAITDNQASAASGASIGIAISAILLGIMATTAIGAPYVAVFGLLLAPSILLWLFMILAVVAIIALIINWMYWEDDGCFNAYLGASMTLGAILSGLIAPPAAAIGGNPATVNTVTRILNTLSGLFGLGMTTQSSTEIQNCI